MCARAISIAASTAVYLISLDNPEVNYGLTSDMQNYHCKTTHFYLAIYLQPLV